MPYQNGPRSSPKGASLYCPYSICVISKYPYYNALRDCLSRWASPLALSLPPLSVLGSGINVTRCFCPQPDGSAEDMPEGRVGHGEGLRSQAGPSAHSAPWSAPRGEVLPGESFLHMISE